MYVTKLHILARTVSSCFSAHYDKAQIPVRRAAYLSMWSLLSVKLPDLQHEEYIDFLTA